MRSPCGLGMFCPGGLLGTTVAAVGQRPFRANVVAGVAGWVALQGILVLWFGFPKLTGRVELSDNPARPPPGTLDVGDSVQRDLLLLVIQIKNRRPITGSDVIALPVLGGWVVNLEEEFQQRPVIGLVWVVGDFERLGVAGVIAVGGMCVAAAGVAHPGGHHTGLHAEQVLHAPEAATGENSDLVVVGHDCCPSTQVCYSGTSFVNKRRYCPYPFASRSSRWMNRSDAELMQ